MKNKFLLGAILLGFGITLISCKSTPKKEDMNEKLKNFIHHYEMQVKDLNKEMAEAYFVAAVSGKEEDYKKSAEAEIKLNGIHSNSNDFAALKEIKESGEVTDPLLLRELNTIYNMYLPNQLDKVTLDRLVKMQNNIEMKYSTFRAVVGDDTLSDNEIEEVLKTSTDNDYLKNTWLAHKKIGNEVAADILALVKLRNEVAVKAGFDNYHQMKLMLSDQDPKEIEAIFDELDALTAPTFALLKDQIDSALALRYGIDKSELMPWHYQNRFFQEAPKLYHVDLDQYYKGKDIEKLTIDHYASLGLDITDMLAHSDLYEKPGKNQHAFCIDIDNEGDVRVLCNIKDNYNWMNTMLHEFGHACYDKYNDTSLPYVLREPAHIFTTEAIAMFNGRLASNPDWMLAMGLIDEETRNEIAEESFLTLRLEQLTFSRWAQVMYRFEKSMYENPDQDLNALWWQLVEKYQLLKKPEGRNEPDWASKIHIATSPCYYHNYLLGELFASQLDHYIRTNVLHAEAGTPVSFTGNEAIGQYLDENIFKPGAKWHWNEMIEKATGEKLTAKYYAAQFVK